MNGDSPQTGATGSDPIQGTRSDMNWSELNGDKAALLTHWQKISQFRARHTAVGRGQQTTLSSNGYYAFSRQDQQDKVMVVWAGNHP